MVSIFDEVGTIAIWPAAKEPVGWMMCVGQAISRSIYKELFAVIGTTYGAGDGSTTFNIPSLEGKIIRQGSSSVGTARGVNSYTLTDAQVGLVAHTHQQSSAHVHGQPAHTHWIDNHIHSVGAETFGPYLEGGSNTGAALVHLWKTYTTHAQGYWSQATIANPIAMNTAAAGNENTTATYVDISATSVGRTAEVNNREAGIDMLYIIKATPPPRYSSVLVSFITALLLDAMLRQCSEVAHG